MAALPPPTTGPAGWYPDPEGGPLPRYFDGRVWLPPVARLESTQQEPHPTLPLAAAVGAIAILVVSLIGGRFLIDVLVHFDWPVLVYIVVLTLLGYGPSLWWCWYASRRWGTGHLSRDVGVRWRWSDTGWGPLTWISAVMCQVVVAAAVLAIGVPTSSNTEDVNELQADRTYVIALLVTAVIAAPFVEEMVFRGVVLRGFLSRMGAVLAIALQAVLFGAAHVDPVRGAGNLGLAAILSAVGAAFGTAAYLLRRIGPTIVAHAIFNAVVLTIVLSGLADELDDSRGRPVEPAVVDEAHVAEPRRGEESVMTLGPIDAFEGVRFDDDAVLQARERFSGERVGGGLLDIGT